MDKEIHSGLSSTSGIRFAIISTDAIVFMIRDKKLCTLVGKVRNNPFYPNHWAAIGGLVRPEETAREAVARLLADKAGIRNGYMEQLATFSGIHRDPRGRVVSVAYIVIVNDGDQRLDGAGVETRWLPVGHLPRLAYDHNQILTVATDRLRSRIEYTDIARHFLPREFTITELQNVHQLVLGRALDKRNFRKKAIASGLIRKLGKTRRKGVMRPAALYEFTHGKARGRNIL